VHQTSHSRQERWQTASLIKAALQMVWRKCAVTNYRHGHSTALQPVWIRSRVRTDQHEREQTNERMNGRARHNTDHDNPRNTDSIVQLRVVVGWYLSPIASFSLNNLIRSSSLGFAGEAHRLRLLSKLKPTIVRGACRVATLCRRTT
jgi:hypothetical protein